MYSQKQLFISHTWRYDELNRDTHLRVMQICDLIKEFGWTVWLDEEQMKGNIDTAMVQGVRNCEIFIACLTKQYITKVNLASENARIRDNCYKEWSFSNSINKYILPVILEPSVLEMTDKGIIDLILGNTLYVDLSGNISKTEVKKLHKMLLKCDVKPALCKIIQPNLKTYKFIHNLLLFTIIRRKVLLTPPVMKQPTVINRQFSSRRHSKSMPNMIYI